MSEAKYASGGNQFESMRLPVIEYIRNDGIEPERERERENPYGDDFLWVHLDGVS